MSTPNIVAVAAVKEPRSFVRTVIDAAGNRLQIVAAAAKNGASFYIVSQKPAKVKNRKGSMVDGFETIDRGATTPYPDLTAAKAAVIEAEAVAVKAGWLKPAGPKGFVAKPDAFTLKNLPKPVKK